MSEEMVWMVEKSAKGICSEEERANTKRIHWTISAPRHGIKT